ncbi:hypothetical protein PCL_06956 [Purpureocillium lilacinum]|uniref:Uncharacterized protein n=1 Tax=Purpureocillium lilacinum TaxID=33203 RepID=A0A2U3DTF6_PURLI|nr:hypothetical protein PCL_06956 [Purpureocillium lilacinum]
MNGVAAATPRGPSTGSLIPAQPQDKRPRSMCPVNVTSSDMMPTQVGKTPAPASGLDNGRRLSSERARVVPWGLNGLKRRLRGPEQRDPTRPSQPCRRRHSGEGSVFHGRPARSRRTAATGMIHDQAGKACAPELGGLTVARKQALLETRAVRRQQT